MRTVTINMRSEIPPKDYIIKALTYTLFNVSVDDKRAIYYDYNYNEGIKAKERNTTKILISDPFFVALRTEAIKFKVDLIWVIRALINYYRRYQEKIEKEIAMTETKIREFVFDPTYANNLYVFYNNATRVLFVYFNDTAYDVTIANQVYEIRIPFINSTEYEAFKQNFMTSDNKLAIVYRKLLENIKAWSVVFDILVFLYEDYMSCKKQLKEMGAVQNVQQ